MSAFVIAMLAESSVRSALLMTFVAAILTLLRIRAAASKHAAWTAVLCGKGFAGDFFRFGELAVLTERPSKVGERLQRERMFRAEGAALHL